MTRNIEIKTVFIKMMYFYFGDYIFMRFYSSAFYYYYLVFILCYHISTIPQMVVLDTFSWFCQNIPIYIIHNIEKWHLKYIKISCIITRGPTFFYFKSLMFCSFRRVEYFGQSLSHNQPSVHTVCLWMIRNPLHTVRLVVPFHSGTCQELPLHLLEAIKLYHQMHQQYILESKISFLLST